MQRIRKCFNYENKNILNNEVEVDEVYIGGKIRNDKNKPNAQGRSTKYKTPIFGMVERNGKLNAKKVNNAKCSTLFSNIVRYVKDATIYSDEWLGYRDVKKLYEHYIIKHGQNEYVNGNIYTNTIEGFWAILKRGFLGTYQYVSKKHIQIYVDEFVFRYNTRKMSESDRFGYLIKNIGVRTRYSDLKMAG
mgnify:CR=1 FL=1